MNAEEFLKQKDLFQLGLLPTETPHPLTVELSQLAETDVDKGIKTLREVDLLALRALRARLDESEKLFTAVADTLESGNKVYLVGCGATGRLSISIEYLWRRKHPGSDQVCSLMAGGDVALVHALEGFEDFPAYGARHLMQLGFTENDLLIGTTEGGETPYVIGAVEAAAEKSKRKPFFIYCNTRQILIDKVERSRKVLTNPKIETICLDVGPMGLTGSTRMQASTVLMLVAGLPFEYGRDFKRAKAEVESWIRFTEQTDAASLKGFIFREAETYQSGDYTYYEADDFAMTVFTDTTERAPTFNLAAFDNPKFPTPKHSLTYISLPSTENAEQAWRLLLAHDPRQIKWPEVHAKTSDDYLYSYDFSRQATTFRKKLLPDAQHFPFQIHAQDGDLYFRFRQIEERFPLSKQNALFDHLTLKMLMNMHSTLVMGRLGRFEGNLMTWVYPSNGKLVDRAARYTQILLKKKGQDRFSYDEIVRAQFQAKENLLPSESIVHKTIAILTK